MVDLPGPRMKKRIVVAVPVLLLVVAAVVFTNLFPFRQMLAADRSVAAAEQELAEMEAANLALETELAALKTPEETERLARDELGYVFPGEQGFVVVSPDEESAVGAGEVTEEELPDPRPWYAPIVDFLTGRDLEG